MGVEADRVVVELEAKTGGFVNDAKNAATAYEGAMRRVGAAATGAEKSIAHSVENTRVSQQILMHVVRGSTDQFAAGAPVAQIFAQHIAMVAEAAQFAGGAMGKFGAFLGGPWGIAVTAAVSILGTLIAKHGGAGEEAKKHRDAEDLLSSALHGEKVATEALLDAVTRLNKEQQKALETETALRDVRYANARGEINDAIKKKAELEKQLTEARKKEQEAAQRQSAASGKGLEAAAGEYQAAHGEVQRLESLVNQQTAIINQASSELAGTMVSFARDVSTAAGRVKVEFDRRQAALEVEFQGTPDSKGVLRGGRFQQDSGNAKKLADDTAELQRREHQLSIEREKAMDAARKLDDAERGRAKTDEDLTQFIRPVRGGRITGTVGEQRPGHTHAGLDIAVPVGTPVSAAAAGVVIQAGTIPGYGNVIVIDHGRGTLTRYAHLSQIEAKAGQTVEQGAVIGLSGGAKGARGAGDSTGPHLHYEVRVGGRAVDPNKGAFPTDQLGVQNTAQRLQRQEQARQEKAARDQATFENELARQNESLLAAKKSNVFAADDIAAAEIEAVKAERDRLNATWLAAKNEGKINEAQRQQITAVTNAAAAEKIRHVNIMEQQRVDELRLTLALNDYRDQENILRARDQLARTMDERRAIELQLLDLQHQERLLEIQRLRQKQGLSDAEKAQLDRQETAENSVYQLQRESTIRSTAGPLESFLQQLPRNAKEANEALERIAVDGLQQLNNGLADAIANSKSLGDVFHNVAKQIIADLIRMALQQAELKIFGSFLGGGGGSAGGGLSAIGSVIGHLFGRASGGYVGAGQLVRVNEGAGPGRVEGFRPQGSGTIVPLGQMNAANRPAPITVVNEFSFDMRGVVTSERVLGQVNAMVKQGQAQSVAAAVKITEKSAPGRLRQYQTLGS